MESPEPYRTTLTLLRTRTYESTLLEEIPSDISRYLIELHLIHDGFEGRAFFFCGRFWICFGVPGSMLSCFSASLLLCFSSSLLFCFSAFLLLYFSAFPAYLLSLLIYFSASLLSLLLCFSAFVPFYFYYSTFSSISLCFCYSTSCSSCASLLIVCTVSLFFIFFCFILSCLYPKWTPRETLGETQRDPKEILIW